LLAFGQYLYASTTWGCIIVADAITMKPLSVFRCHGNEEYYCKAILPIGPAVHADTSGENDWKQTMTKPTEGAADTDNAWNSGIVTIGRGYVDVIKCVTSLESRGLVQSETKGWSLVDSGVSPVVEHTTDKSAKSNTYVLSWDTQNWNYY